MLEATLSGQFAVLERGIYYLDQVSGQGRLQFYDFASRRSTVVARSLGDIAEVGGLTASPTAEPFSLSAGMPRWTI